MFKLPNFDAGEIHKNFKQYSPAYKTVLSAILAVFSAIFQSAGGFLPGIGFIISPFATLPIIFAVVYARRYGILAYFLTIFLLMLIQPAELFIFPFTTGLLGLALGYGIMMCKYWASAALAGAISLSAGIMIPLFIIGYPILGPLALDGIQVGTVLIILLFSFLYSFMWLFISLAIMGRIERMMGRGKM